MTVTVYLFAGLDKKFPGYDLLKGLQVTLGARSSVRNLLKKLEIPLKNITLVIVNGKRTGITTRLHDGDRIDIFPPVGGG